MRKSYNLWIYWGLFQPYSLQPKVGTVKKAIVSTSQPSKHFYVLKINSFPPYGLVAELYIFAEKHSFSGTKDCQNKRSWTFCPVHPIGFQLLRLIGWWITFKNKILFCYPPSMCDFKRYLVYIHIYARGYNLLTLTHFWTKRNTYNRTL